MRHCTLFLVLFLAGCGGDTAPAPVFFGHVATLSGPDRGIGQQETRGIRLAVEEWAKDKITVSDRPIQVKHTDARGDLDAFESQAVRLVSVSRVLAIFGGNTPEEASRLARSEGVLVTPLGFRPRGTTDRVFAIGMSPGHQGKALAEFAIEKKAERAVLLVDDRREASYPLAEAFERVFATQDNTPRMLEKIRFGKDVNVPLLAKRLDVKALHTVVFLGSAADFTELQKAWSAPEGSLVFFAGDDGALRKAKGAVYLATAFAADPDQPRTGEFIEKFKKAFQEPPDVHAALAYDGVRLMADALRRAQPPSSEKFLEALRGVKDFPGVTGKVSFGGEQTLQRPVYIGKLEGEEFTLQKTSR